MLSWVPTSALLLLMAPTPYSFNIFSPTSVHSRAMCTMMADGRLEETQLQQALRKVKATRQIAMEVFEDLDEMRETSHHTVASLARSEARMSQLLAEISIVGDQVGWLLKAGVSNAVVRESPDLEPSVAGSLVELASLFGKEKRLSLARSAARKLLDEETLPNVMAHALSKLKARRLIDEHTEWITPDNKVDEAKVGSCIDTISTDRAELGLERAETNVALKLGLAQMMPAVKAVRRGSHEDAVKVSHDIANWCVRCCCVHCSSRTGM
eukprot:TRINITY_DN1369_c1_g1_i2.p1 TRINITY_DN1369_c1_g1~~TRINITY_DN1369_c1_g1_i2.p1  ORF type:complete len:268 (+),score=62.41 TRINITY_DN1369_c1_g1_i2:104-907(+)